VGKKKSERVYQDISIFLKLKIQQHGNIVFCIREGGRRMKGLGFDSVFDSFHVYRVHSLSSPTATRITIFRNYRAVPLLLLRLAR